METVVVFVPDSILKQDKPGYLLGFLNEHPQLFRKDIYILETKSPHQVENCSNNILGTFTLNNRESLFIDDKLKVCLHIRCSGKDIVLKSCILNGISLPLSKCIVITYEIDSLIKSELFLSSKFDESTESNHFKILANSLKEQTKFKVKKWDGFNSYFIKLFFMIFSCIHTSLSKGNFLPTYSLLACHIKNCAYSLLWNCQVYEKKKSINLKIGNYLMSTICDVFIGLLVYNLLCSSKSAEDMFISLSISTKNVIDTISELVKLLMGSPAGLKLNQPLSNLLGSLVLYYLDIWWSFLSFVQPVLEFAFFLLIKIGFLGFTFQLAVCADILSIISFHVYCIYIYAARLYEIQAKGLFSLSRLVLGRKRNPERGKIDSCPYSTEELLIGTISFAVLLFLLPTTLVYYVVFTVMRVGVKALHGLINWTMYFIQTLPVFSTIVWIFFPYYTATTMKLSPSNVTLKSQHCSLIAESANSPWLDTIKQCIPDTLSPPGPVPVSSTMWKIITGKLI